MKYPLHRKYDDILIHYDPLTGEVNIPTCLNGKKYYAFKCNNESIKVHLFAFYYMTGKWPTEFIDHIDENKLNNKWDNLQELSSSLNQIKSSTKRRSNTSGYIGVSFNTGNKKWLWHLQLRGVAHRKYCINCPTKAALERDKFIIENKIPAYLNLLGYKLNETRK